MGTVINRRVFRQLSDSLSQALFILHDAKSIPADATRVNVGFQLSETLQAISAEKRAEKLEELLCGLMPHDTDIELCRIDILFDPVWHLDVLRLFLSAGRNKRLYVAWPGKITDNILCYSEPGFPDYCVYDTNRYIDTYIIAK